MLNIRLCKGDPLVETVRELVEAMPLRVPEERFQPLCLMATVSGKLVFLGHLSNALVHPPDFKGIIAASRMASISGKSSRRVDAALGLEILEGFLTGPEAERLGDRWCSTRAWHG